ncbi:MAG: AAA family ATPase [Planctomycetota bacterium]
MTPCLLLIAGLPGTGKSTLASHLATAHGFHWIDTDAVRKELAGIAPTDRRKPDDPMYTPEAIQRVYEVCVERVRAQLQAGVPVAVSATFAKASYRRPFVELAAECGVPLRILLVELAEDEVRRRLEARMAAGHDVSDADTSVWRKVAARWEAFDAVESAATLSLDTTGITPDAANARMVEWLLGESSR